MNFTVRTLLAVAALTVAASTARAACYADYKAKQENPLRLHYGVMELQISCDPDDARGEVTKRLNSHGWTLLNVMSVFGPEGLQSRKASAGPNFLRF